MQKTPWMNIAPSSMSVKTLKTVTHFFFFLTLIPARAHLAQ